VTTTPMDGIPDREADGPRETMAIAQRRRFQPSRIPRIDDSEPRPCPVRVLVSGGRKITGERFPVR
jgi:hypothetical protein